MDKMTPEQRHRCMAAIRATGTKPEMLVRRYLHAAGFRYRLNHRRLPGHPDLVLRKYRTCIFVNGCFWHGHRVDFPAAADTEGSIVNSACCKIPQTNRDFWVAKISRYQRRDREEQCQLAAMGWHCITVWECELRPKVRAQTLESLAYTLNRIFLQDHELRYADIVELPGEQQMAAEPLGNAPKAADSSAMSYRIEKIRGIRARKK